MYMQIGTIRNPASMSQWPAMYLEREENERLIGELWLEDYIDGARLWGSFDIPWPEVGCNMNMEHLELLDYFRTTLKQGGAIWPTPWPDEGGEVPAGSSIRDLAEMFITGVKFSKPKKEEEDDNA